MELTHRFTVPTTVEEAWAHFNDIASVAECFPGAQVTSFDGDSFQGSVKVKLGPIALLYTGAGTFVEKDETQHRFVVDAKGKDKRGNGTAGAMVTLTMVPAETAAGSATDVEVLTDLAITGKPAQFGRGVMQDVSDKLLGQFVACLESRLATPEEEAPPAEEAAALVSESPAADQAVAAEPAPDGPDAAPRQAPPPSAPRPAPADDDALDLGATVLPVLAKAYGKQVVGGLAALLVLWWLVRKLR